MRTFRRRTGVVTAQLALTLSLAPAFPSPAHAIPMDNGNSWNSGNFRAKGRLVNSGNFENANGAVNSGNTSGGNNANGPQCVVERKSKGGCWRRWPFR
ncbi:hypothetical protein ABZ897_07130 [Nonomuraea sp. NPDC046802]|uniref:hypothetical protein n=1 Tax=Nonomuraea sp. NPDC046802 TaxID=3154919 RepID=UPI0033D1773E